MSLLCPLKTNSWKFNPLPLVSLDCKAVVKVESEILKPNAFPRYQDNYYELDPRRIKK